MTPRHLSMTTASLVIISALTAQADTIWTEKVVQPYSLGPPQVSFPTSIAGSHSAFPVEILERMRTRLLERAEVRTQNELPLSKQDDE